MTIHERISALRMKMEEKGLQAYIIPSEDPHGSEYVAPYWQCRKWISGFTGSAATVVVTKDTAGLWTDFRYYIQAEDELKDSGIELFKYGMPGVPSYEQWLSENIRKGEAVGLDGKNYSVEGAAKLEALLGKAGIRLETEAPLIDSIWTENRPALPMGRLFLHDEKYNGRSRADKLKALRDVMSRFNATHHVLSALEDICWLFNIRGRDLDTIPVAISYAIITMDSAELFVHEEKAADVKEALKKDRISIRPYDDIVKALSSIGKGSLVLADRGKLSISLVNSLGAGAEIRYETNPTTAMKARKNEVEIENLRRVMERDGAAMVRFIKWIGENSLKGQTELSLAAKLLSFRKRGEDFAGESFTPIPGYRAHGALCHYSADEEGQFSIDEMGGLFLIDSGGQYPGGTTDITRTLTLGNPTAREIRDYTLVLKGHIALSLARFPQGTRGYQLDLLARMDMWREGIDYGHGTGHGVGHYLSVHEGPMRISTHPVDVALEPGMVISNEPGIYREGSHGIRIENLILVREDRETEFGKFYDFETLTLCPYDPELIDHSLLNDDERSWINKYNEEVYNRVAPYLDDEEKSWLKGRTIEFTF
ncbi:MAG: aminopeptidase P family protein [Spirochaetales bacterium]|nr:aminopeptidase P family protein [Spirochaetales bacterium]